MSDQDKTKEQLIAELEELRERIRSGSQPTKHLEAELHRQQEHLRRSEERLRLALEAGRMGIWEWTIQTDQVVWSPGLETIHGLAPGKFLGPLRPIGRTSTPRIRIGCSSPSGRRSKRASSTASNTA